MEYNKIIQGEVGNTLGRFTGFLLFVLLFFCSITLISSSITAKNHLSPAGMKLIDEKIASYPPFDLKKIEKDAEKRYPLIKEGETTTLSDRKQTAKGKFYGINSKYVRIGTKEIARFDLNQEQLSRFIPALNADMRRKYIKKQKSIYRSEKRCFEDSVIAPLLKKYPAVSKKMFSKVFSKLKDKKLAEKYIEDLINFYDESLPIPDDVSKKQFVRNVFHKFIENNDNLVLDGFYVISAKEKKRLDDIIRKRQELKEKKLAERIAYPCVATPVFSPDGGIYDPAKKVTIIDSTPNSEIHYTLNNEIPTEESPVYTSPISMKMNQRLKAVAFHKEFNDSDVACMSQWRGSGLYASYFNRTNFTGKTFVKLEKNIFLNLNKDKPPKGVKDDYFTALWTGQLIPAKSGEYTFYLSGDDGVRMWLNGKLFIDGWVEQAKTEYKETFNLVAGKKYDIKLALIDLESLALIMLEWSSNGLSRQPIPSNCLTPFGRETDNVRKWNKKVDGIYINRRKMVNPGSYRHKTLLRKCSSQNKSKLLQDLKKDVESE